MLSEKCIIYLESVQAIPTKQQPFRRKRFIEAVCKILVVDVKRTLTPHVGLSSTRSARRLQGSFDSAPKDMVMVTMAEVDVFIDILNIFAAILQESKITMKWPNPPSSTQAAGLTYEDNLSPFLFLNFAEGPPWSNKRAEKIGWSCLLCKRFRNVQGHTSSKCIKF